MGKPKPLSGKSKSNSSKMAEIISEKRKPGESLKRSKSVRASLRTIGNKFLHYKSTNDSLTKVKSLTNLTDIKHKKDFKRSCSHDDSQSILYNLPEIFVRETSMFEGKNSVIERTKVKQTEKIKITTPPSKIAPKAAQILQIPIKENVVPLSFHCEPFLRNKNNNFVSDVEWNCPDKYSVGYDYRRNTFNRNSIRLSLASSKRKHSRNLSTVEKPSM